MGIAAGRQKTARMLVAHLLNWHMLTAVRKSVRPRNPPLAVQDFETPACPAAAVEACDYRRVGVQQARQSCARLSRGAEVAVASSPGTGEHAMPAGTVVQLAGAVLADRAITQVIARLHPEMLAAITG
jgi:hypothetical protein